jgi:hypothetical protein
VADRGLRSHAFREHVWKRGGHAGDPGQAQRGARGLPGLGLREPHRVERLGGRLKEWRARRHRYEKTARSFMGVLCLAASLDWLRR